MSTEAVLCVAILFILLIATLEDDVSEVVEDYCFKSPYTTCAEKATGLCARSQHGEACRILLDQHAASMLAHLQYPKSDPSVGPRDKLPRAINIVSPNDGDVLVTDELFVVADVQPIEIPAGNSLCLVLHEVEDSCSGGNAQLLKGVQPGRLTMRFEIRSEDGSTVIASPPVTVHVVPRTQCTTRGQFLTRENPQQSRPKVVDAIFYENDLELLELRLVELRDIVDEFHVLDFSRQDNGMPRSPIDELLRKSNNLDVLADVLQRVNYAAIPSTVKYSWEGMGEAGSDSRKWHLMVQYLAEKQVQDTDFVVLGEARDIPREDLVHLVVKCQEVQLPARLVMDHHVFNFNWRAAGSALHSSQYPVITVFGLLSIVPLFDLVAMDQLTLRRKFGLSLMTTLHSGGWRCTSFVSTPKTLSRQAAGSADTTYSEEGMGKVHSLERHALTNDSRLEDLDLDFQPFPQLPRGIQITRGHSQFAHLVPFEHYNYHLRPAASEPLLSDLAAHSHAYLRAFLPLRFPGSPLDITPLQGEGGRQGRCHGHLDWPSENQEVGLFVGIVSHPSSRGRRDAIRQTWLSHHPTKATRHTEGIEHRFILGLVGEAQIIPTAVLAEAKEHGDIAVLAVREGYKNVYYKALGGLRYGVQLCGASYVMRANDDIYADLGAVMARIAGLDPYGIHAGLEVESIRVLRPEMFEDGAAPEKSSAVSYGQWPSEVYPRLIQGNAILLSADLSEKVVAVTQMPWLEVLADDLRISVVASVDGLQWVGLNASWAPDGAPVTCNTGASLHFDLNADTMQHIHSNVVNQVPPCHGVEPW